ncbi:hypothetical protein [Faecalispora anaeroviscerum]|uniref:hypothetical protein n=1 Tax=Faecalispora anaeroviscerum TaxID=2991836 RepID=UPI0024BB27D5|nr:hypothetical protein [Faecalispora anaeroviscerum]
MTFEGITAGGIVCSLGTPLSVRISRGAGAPADELIGEFPWSALPPLYRLRVSDGERIVFFGPVDVQQERISPKGAFLRVEGRSLAALLLDNEAVPQTYYSPPFSTVFSRHAAPYGFSRCRVPGSTEKIGEFTVTKGMSEWQVLESFCRRAWSASPVFQDGNELTVGASELGETLLFGNQGLRYLSLTKTQKAYKRISEILVRSAKDGRYTVSVTEEQALREGICRRRCLSSSSGISAKQALASARQKSLEYTLVLPGWPDVRPGRNAELNDRTFGRGAGLRVWSVDYDLDTGGMLCTVTLRRAGE